MRRIGLKEVPPNPPSPLLQVEANRQALGIEEYSLSQTTLEQVFVNLAQREAATHPAAE